MTITILIIMTILHCKSKMVSHTENWYAWHENYKISNGVNMMG